MDERPQIHAVEPEIIPPDRRGRHPEDAMRGVHVVIEGRRYEWSATAKPRPIAASLILLLLAIAGVVVLVLLAGTVAIWVVVLLALFAVVTVAATLGRFWRRLRGG